MGRLFSSFDETWTAFVKRREPLEDFFAAFPETEAHLTVWLATPGDAVAAEAAWVARRLETLDGLRLTPGHWLHVSLGEGHAHDVERVRDRLRGLSAFEATYGPATCFHDAVVLEARGDGFAELATAIEPGRELSFFLPHLSVAYVDGTPDPGPIRDRLVELRDRPRVRELISEIELCVVPVARGDLLTPWRRVSVASLGEATGVRRSPRANA